MTAKQLISKQIATKRITAIIADDELHAIDRLQELLSQQEQFEVVAVAKNGTEALEEMIQMKPDVAFLDINMPGISVLQSIPSLQDPPIVIFQTAHSKYATDAFDMNALDYLMKPISKERFQQAIAKILSQLQNTTAIELETSDSEIKKEEEPALPEPLDHLEKIAVKFRDGIKIIGIGDITRISFEEGLCFIYTLKERFISDKSINYYESKFKDFDFFRTNRANMVNLAFVTTIYKGIKGSYYIKLTNDFQVEVSRRKAFILKKKLEF